MSPTAFVHPGLLALYGSIVLLACNGIFSKVIPLDATSVSQTRSVIACLALLLVLRLSGQRWPLKDWRQSLGVYALGVLLGLHWITYFYAMQTATVAIGMLSLFSYPVITVVLEPLLLRHLPRWPDLLAALLVFGGVLLMVLEDLLGGDYAAATLEGALVGLLSALLFSVRNTVQKHYFAGVNSLAMMAHQTCAVALILLPFVDRQALGAMQGGDWLMLLVLGCLSTAMAHTLLSVALKRLPAKSVGLISCATPVVGGALAWWLLGEAPEFMVFVGGAVILSVAAFETLKQK